MSTAVGIVAFIILAAMIITLCASLYISTYHLGRIESLLPNSAFVSGNKKTFTSRPYWQGNAHTLNINTANSTKDICTERIS